MARRSWVNVWVTVPWLFILTVCLSPHGLLKCSLVWLCGKQENKSILRQWWNPTNNNNGKSDGSWQLSSVTCPTCFMKLYGQPASVAAASLSRVPHIRFSSFIMLKSFALLVTQVFPLKSGEFAEKWLVMGLCGIQPLPLTTPTWFNAMYQTDANQMQHLINYLMPMIKKKAFLHPHTPHIAQTLKIACCLYQSSPAGLILEETVSSNQLHYSTVDCSSLGLKNNHPFLHQIWGHWFGKFIIYLQSATGFITAP